nr:ATP-binding cassette domain-containing protein [Herpetosiphon giganteus]
MLEESTVPIIDVRNLGKTYRTIEKEGGVKGAVKALFRPQYREKVAVHDLNFQIDAGEIVGYIGVNGAGKSTTIKMLTGILYPTTGSISVLGHDPQRERVANARNIGVVFGQRSQLWWDLALIESLNLVANIYEVEPSRYKQLLSHFAEVLELDEILKTPIRSMSLGQKMRAELAATFIHEPKVVYLDEPTIGLDVMVKQRIREFIKDYNQTHNTTVMLTTHDLGDIEQLCSRVIIIDAGSKVYDGPLNAIKQQFGKFRTITFETNQPIVSVNLPPACEQLNLSEFSLEVRFDRSQISASQVANAVMQQLDVADFTLNEPDLESIIKHLYQNPTAYNEVGARG